MNALAEPQPRRNVLSIDVEDWYHDNDLALRHPPGERVEHNTQLLLEMLARRGARATFFFLGLVAERFPQLVREVAAGGHEIASHGYHHREMQAYSGQQVYDDVHRSIALLEDIIGERVLGYRAPYFSVVAEGAEHMEALQRAGVVYDSSVIGTRRRSGDFYLLRPRRPFHHTNGLLEIPVAMLRVAGLYYLPMASGGGLRFLGVDRVDRMMQTFEHEVGPALFYLHPWEFDPDSPTAPLRGRWMLRFGREAIAARFDALLSRMEFAPINEVFAAALGPQAASGRPRSSATTGPV